MTNEMTDLLCSVVSYTSYSSSSLHSSSLSPTLPLRVLVSPASERKFIKRMREKDKMFDSVLALAIPCELSVVIFL